MTVTHHQKMALIRAVGLIGRFGDALSDFEAQLVSDCVERFRDRGERMTLTPNEWAVLQAAIDAMDAVKARREHGGPAIDPIVAAPHPFAWLRDHMTAAEWTAWIEPLALGDPGGIGGGIGGGGAVIWCPDVLVMNQARDLAGPTIRRRWGAVAWAVRR